MPRSEKPKKKRAPIKQLKHAAFVARKRLIELGVITKDSSIERIKKEYPNVPLPGLYPYLPHKETLVKSQRGMYDLLKLWQYENTKDGKKNIKNMDNLGLFVDFMYSEMDKIENTAKNKEKMTEQFIKDTEDIPVLGDLFKHTNLYQTAKAVKKFYVDSLAIFVWVKNKDSNTGNYAEWFFDWTKKLHGIWEENEKKSKQTNEVSGKA